jgi:hypothetical protein
MPENSAYYQEIYAQYPSHYNYHHAIASAHRITNSIDARQAQTYDNQDYFDFGRYTKLLIDLCSDFPIVGINTRIDW